MGREMISPCTPRSGRSAILALGFSLLLALGCAGENLLMIAPPVNSDQTIHVVIENPAGSFEKWEVQSSGELVQELQDGQPLRMPGEPWPANAGMIPRTLLSEELGGDQEPIDVLVLGDALARGELVRAVPIALLQVIDRLERDDKVIAVTPGTPYADFRSMEEVDEAFPGLLAELAKWYDLGRPGSAIEVQGFGSRAAAQLLIAEGALAFDAALRAGTLPDWTSVRTPSQ